MRILRYCLGRREVGCSLQMCGFSLAQQIQIIRQMLIYLLGCPKLRSQREKIINRLLRRLGGLPFLPRNAKINRSFSRLGRLQIGIVGNERTYVVAEPPAIRIHRSQRITAGDEVVIGNELRIGQQFRLPNRRPC